MRTGDPHAAVQRRYFEQADADRFAWTTAGPGFAETEDELLGPLLPLIESPCLEVGCGEGNNLVRLVRHARCFGVDLFPRKLAFAADAVPEATLVTADASRLPFAAGSFRTLFVRDLLHHVQRPRELLAGALEALAPGGRLCLLEPNARNPLVRLQTRLIPAEAGARVFSPSHVGRLLEGLPLCDVEICTRQPLLLRRLVLHYRFGLPSLGRNAGVRRLLAGMEAALGRTLPASRWSYVQVTARRTHS